MTTIARDAPAKINLTLRVAGLRPDGFHEIESLVSRIDLADRVSVRSVDHREIHVACNAPGVPDDARNLAHRAATTLAKALRTAVGGEILIEKRIPVGSGLGGGSSDAAATLLLLNELWDLHWPFDRLAAVGATIGSDVPLFLHGPLCVLRGRGESVEELPYRPALWVALLLPAIHAATPAVYRAWDRLPPRSASPALAGVNAHITRANELMPQLFNDLEPAALAEYPGLRELVERAQAAAPGPLRMSGSGSAFFRLYDSREAAEEFAARVRSATGVRVEVTRMSTR